MRDDQAETLLLRLENIERRLREAVVRLEAIEGRSVIPAHEPISHPPPVPVFDMAPQPEVHQDEPTLRMRPEPEPLYERESTPSHSAEETEFKLGGRVLPRVGAGVFLTGIGYLVGLGILRGWISPWMLFIGALVLCLAFVGIGLWKLSEREEFGYLLVGIGSCGLYLTFAGGNLYQHLYSDRVMVALFLLASFGNLAFCLRRSAQSFLAIGVLGGIAAVLMPLQKSPDLVMPLHFAIIIPAILIAAKNRWSLWMILIWFASAAPVVGYAMSDANWTTKVAFLYCSAFVQIAVMSMRYEGHTETSAKRPVYEFVGITAIDPGNQFPLAAVVMAMLGAFAIQLNAAHLATFAVGITAMSVLLPKENTRGLRLAATAANSFLVLAPATGSFGQAATWYSIEAIVCSASSMLPFLRVASVAAFALWGMGLLAYTGAFALPPQDETRILLLASAAGLAAALAARRTQLGAKPLTLTAAIIGIVLFSRLGVVALSPETWTLTVVWTAYASALLTVGFAIKEKELRYLGLALFGAAVVKVLTIDIAEVSEGIRVVVLMLLGLAMLGAGYWYIRSRHG